MLEALASGVPVLTSNVSSMPEVAGDAALTVDPLDETAIRDGLIGLLEDTHWRTGAIEAGLARAQAFPWSRCVEDTIAVYREAQAG